jgi:phosphoglycolate phosphatase
LIVLNRRLRFAQSAANIGAMTVEAQGSPDHRSDAWTLLCDPDGTLADSLPDLAAALDRLLEDYRRPPLPEAEVRLMVGDGATKLVERAFAARGLAATGTGLATATTRFLEIYEGGLALSSRPYPGTVDALSRLKEAGWRLAVITNKPERAAWALLEALDLARFFDALAGGDTFPVKKPDPGHALRLLGAMGAEPTRAILYGDGANDAYCARGAGLPLVATTHAYGRRSAAELGADAVVAKAAELPATLAALVRKLDRGARV